MEAKRLGYTNVLWIDASFIPLKLKPLFDHIENKGLLFFAYPEYNHAFHIREFAAQALGSSEKDFNQMVYVQTFVMGFNFTNPIALDLFESWYTFLKGRIGFLSHIPELAPFTILINQKNLLPLQGNSHWVRNTYNQDSETLLAWSRDGDLTQLIEKSD